MIDKSKSNLNIKKRNQTSKKRRSVISSRKKEDDLKISNANIIFGLDNGATGTISCIIKYPDSVYQIYFEKTPADNVMDYQKTPQYIARINWKKLKDWFENIIKIETNNYIKKYNFDEKDVKILVVLERPMINAERFKQSKNAARAFEATLIVLEMLNLENNYVIIDSKKWQHYFFGKNTVLIDLKEASKNMGIEFLKSISKTKYKKIIDIINSHGDADSLLISKYALEKTI